MPDHIHVWGVDAVGAICLNRECREGLGFAEVARRLNATEMLGADRAEFFADIVEHVTNSKAPQLRTYASALEGKNEKAP